MQFGFRVRVLTCWEGSGKVGCAKFHKEQTIALELTNETQVQCALESLKTNKATGYDSIPAKTLKLGAR